VVYVYAIVEELDSPPEGMGLQGAPVRVVKSGRLVAIVSDCDGEDVVASEDALWLHETVVERLMGPSAVLPMRFGTVLADDAAVRRLLLDDAGELLAGLRRVRDAVEVAVCVTWELDGERHDPTGMAYLVNRLGRTRGAMQLAERMDEKLGELARASTRQVSTTPQLSLTCAYLVDRDRLGEFRERVDELGDTLDRARVACTGPWPPYSFAHAGHER
jgi:hypothetical protein